MSEIDGEATLAASLANLNDDIFWIDKRIIAEIKAGLYTLDELKVLEEKPRQ